jgi:transposase-like protein
VRSEDEKRRIVSETFEPGASVSAVARRHGLNANLLFTWRREMGRGISAMAGDAMAFVPAVIGSESIRGMSDKRFRLNRGENITRVDKSMLGPLRSIVLELPLWHAPKRVSLR